MKELFSLLVSWGAPGLFLVGLLDGAGIPNPSGPDILLMLYAAAAPDRAIAGALLLTLGSLLGNFFLYSVARKGGQIYLDRHTMTPRGQKLRAWFLHYGMVTVFIPALVPIPMPLKLFVICSGGFAVSRVVFLTTLGTARVARYGTLAWIGSQLSESPLDWLKTHKWDFLGFSAGLFLALFLLIRLVDYRKRKQQQDRLDSGHGNTPLP